MKKMLGISLICIFTYSVIITVLYININYTLKKSNDELKEISEKYNILVHTEAPKERITFYAQIEDVNIEERTILVKGFDFEFLYKGRFNVVISDETWLVRNGNIIQLSDFIVGNHVAITFTGVVEVAEPDKINDVYKIQLFDK